MKKLRFTERQNVVGLKMQEAGMSTNCLSREMGISEHFSLSEIPSFRQSIHSVRDNVSSQVGLALPDFPLCELSWVTHYPAIIRNAISPTAPSHSVPARPIAWKYCHNLGVPRLKFFGFSIVIPFRIPNFFHWVTIIWVFISVL